MKQRRLLFLQKEYRILGRFLRCQSVTKRKSQWRAWKVRGFSQLVLLRTFLGVVEHLVRTARYLTQSKAGKSYNLWKKIRL
uniref:Cancer antigen 1 n=1 Tax=Rousettus aegyptiacus TaxID=9407 RepID=A0A7J8K5Q5_ROUAE|nr:cancer antigen 1 [Rousettus aegyptiacus]